MLTLAPSAVDALGELLHQPEVPAQAGLRIAIAPSTDDSTEIGLTAALVEGPAPGDQVVEEGGARVYVEPETAPFLEDACLQAVDQGDQIAFGLVPADEVQEA